MSHSLNFEEQMHRMDETLLVVCEQIGIDSACIEH